MVADGLLGLKSSRRSTRTLHCGSFYKAYNAQAPTIGMGTLVGRVLEGLGELRLEVPFSNLCPSQTRDDHDPRAPVIPPLRKSRFV